MVMTVMAKTSSLSNKLDNRLNLAVKIYQNAQFSCLSLMKTG